MIAIFSAVESIIVVLECSNILGTISSTKDSLEMNTFSILIKLTMFYSRVNRNNVLLFSIIFFRETKPKINVDFCAIILIFDDNNSWSLVTFNIFS